MDDPTVREHDETRRQQPAGFPVGGPSQAILKQAPGAEIVDFPCSQGLGATWTAEPNP